jgi:hypothetical protein
VSTVITAMVFVSIVVARALSIIIVSAAAIVVSFHFRSVATIFVVVLYRW